jgi:hypothetical protein
MKSEDSLRKSTGDDYGVHQKTPVSDLEGTWFLRCDRCASFCASFDCLLEMP